MSENAATKSAPSSWLFSNPWFVINVGFACGLVAFLWAQAIGADFTPVRFSLIGIGFTASLSALWLRLRSDQPSYLGAMPQSLSLMIVAVLMIVFVALSLGLFAALLLSFARPEWMPWRPGSLFVVNALTQPSSIGALLLLRKRTKNEQPIAKNEETALLLLLAALNCWLYSWALYIDAAPRDWDTIQLMFGALAGAALLGAPLFVLSQTFRRVMIAVLVIVHFGGILTAVFSAPPTPIIVGQLWVRIYRPYLEFMYLNNAYHFYSPEPGAASYLWFRIIYEDNHGREYGEWFKVPKISDDGWHGYEVSLVYSRMLALTERTVPSIQTPSFVNTNENGDPVAARFYENRAKHSKKPKKGKDENKANKGLIGKAEKVGKEKMIIPFHPLVGQINQYSQPNMMSIKLLVSYAKHIARLPHPDSPELNFKRVKIYRVTHALPTQPGPFLHRWRPNDPTWYRPYYLGDYDKDGELLNDPDDPFLYWLLPIIRHSSHTLIDHARRHAGDPNYIYDYKQNDTWVSPDQIKKK